MSSRLPLPEDFNPATFMLKKETENGVFHESRAGARLAAMLLENGNAEDIELAEKVIPVVLSCQEKDKTDPHYGNFYWMLEDSFVQDLNAVEFCLEHLIPMMLKHAARLKPETQTRLKEAIRLGLAEIARLNVLVAYTNICLLDIVNTCLGGELLEDPKIANRGYQKLRYWMHFSDQNGTAFEYNSPTYTNVSIKALKQLAEYSKHEETRARARLCASKLGLSAALHIHKATGRWAGPHSRAYHPSVLCETPPERELFESWLAMGAIPAWLRTVVDNPALPFEVTETASSDRQASLTSYQTAEFALGVASKEYSAQSDVLMLHFRCPKTDKPGVLYTRYLTNEKWLGDFYHATDRTKSRNILDEGLFYGVQNGSKAIGLYTPGNPGLIHSAKLCLILLGQEKVEDVHLDRQRLEQKTFESSGDEWVLFSSSEVYIAIKPLSRSRLGKTAPMRLVERQGDLVLELYNYLGEEKSFWELNWPGFFFQGKPQCGFYLEVASRQDYPDALAFLETLQQGSFKDETGEPITYNGSQERLWTVEYEREGESLGIEIDLLSWSLKRRWDQQGEFGWPMLKSPVAIQNATGRLELLGASLRCKSEPAWLYANPSEELYVAAYHGDSSTHLELDLPTCSLSIDSMGPGTVIWHKGEVKVDALHASMVYLSDKKETR